MEQAIESSFDRIEELSLLGLTKIMVIRELGLEKVPTAIKSWNGADRFMRVIDRKIEAIRPLGESDHRVRPTLDHYIRALLLTNRELDRVLSADEHAAELVAGIIQQIQKGARKN